MLEEAARAMPGDEWFLPTEVLNVLRPQLFPDHFRWLEPQLWRGSIANAVYASLRSPGVHYGGVGHGLSFSATFHGEKLPRVDFHNLHSALTSLAAHARKVSEETGKWFGVD